RHAPERLAKDVLRHLVAIPEDRLRGDAERSLRLVLGGLPGLGRETERLGNPDGVLALRLPRRGGVALRPAPGEQLLRLRRVQRLVAARLERLGLEERKPREEGLGTAAPQAKGH